MRTKKQTTMTFKEQEQFTKKNSVELLSELINFDGENIMGEIVRLMIRDLMELERDEHIGNGAFYPSVLELHRRKHYKRLRTANMLERMNQELKRRTKLVGFPTNVSIISILIFSTFSLLSRHESISIPCLVYEIFT